MWKDTKAVRFISTQCNPTNRCSALRRVSGEYHRIHQPLIASNYSSHYKEVDQFDFLATKYCIARRSYRPWLYLYNFCVQAAIVNAYILYMETNSEPKPKKFYTVRLQAPPRKATNFRLHWQESKSNISTAICRTRYYNRTPSES